MPISINPRPFAETTRQTFKGDQNPDAVPKPREPRMNNTGVSGQRLSPDANYCLDGHTEAELKQGYCDEGRVRASSDPKDFA